MPDSIYLWLKLLLFVFPVALSGIGIVLKVVPIKRVELLLPVGAAVGFGG